MDIGVCRQWQHLHSQCAPPPLPPPSPYYRLGAQTGLFIPVSPLLLDMLSWTEFHHPSRGGAGMVPDMLLQLRASKNTLKNNTMQEEVLSQVGGSEGQ